MYKKWDLVIFVMSWLKWEAVIKRVLEQEWSVTIYEAETLYKLEGDEKAWTWWLLETEIVWKITHSGLIWVSDEEFKGIFTINSKPIYFKFTKIDNALLGYYSQYWRPCKEWLSCTGISWPIRLQLEVFIMTREFVNFTSLPVIKLIDADLLDADFLDV